MSATTLEQVISSPKLPTLPAVAVKVLELARDPDVDLKDIADVVQYDQALAAKILRTVNSSYYRLAQPCPSIKRALTYLGLNTVKSLVLGFSVVELARVCDDEFDLIDYWRRCLYSAAAARRIAMVTGTCDPDEAFIAALMQDIGMLAMHMAMGRVYDQVVSDTGGNHHALPYCETEALGFTHAEAGAKLGERWNLPQQVVDPIREHHRRGTPFGPHSALINAVILAYRMSNLLALVEHRKAVLDMVSAMSQSMFHITPEDEREILLTTADDARELSELLEVKVGQLPDIEAILAADARGSANGTANGHGLNAVQSMPFASATPPPPDEDVDGLTGTGSRRCFDRTLEQSFEDARDHGRPLGLLLIDADRFSTVNERLGRKAGDRVLQVMAHRITAVVGDSGTVYRFGGEEFAVILPGASRMEAARAAERIRRQIERDHVDLSGSGGSPEAVGISASVGVVTLEPEVLKELKSPMGLVQLGERALYAAQCDGRNCVRVFTPRSGRSNAA